MIKQRPMAMTKRVGTAAARATAFVRALTARQAPLRQASPLESVLLRRAAPIAAVQALQPHWHVTIAPRLQLTLASNATARPTEPREMPAPMGVQPPVAGPTFVSQVLEPIRLRSERVDTLRLLQQTQQLNFREPAAAAEAQAAVPVPQAHIERVFHHTVRAAVATATAAPVVPRDMATAAAAAPAARTFGAATQAPAASDVDIGRLADRVVNAIDRRLVAQRERHGRI